MLLALRDALASGEVSAADTVALWLQRLESVHATTACVAEVGAEATLDHARALDDAFVRGGVVGPLHGVPFTVKDWIDAVGFRCTGGMERFRDRRPERDATAVARLRNAGAVLMAKTAVQVDSPLFGPVRNPQDTTRSPGASSSGEAAAVGGGGSPFGLGSDSGGSIRLPAAWCGAAGLKPSAGRIPLTGHFPRLGDRGDGRTQIGPIAADVRDLSLLLSVLAGPDGVDPGAPPVPLTDPADVDVRRLRVARAVASSDRPASAEIVAAVDRAASALLERGATDAGAIDLRLDDAFDITTRYWRRSSLDGEEADRQLRDWDHYRWSMLRAMTDVDVVLSPVSADVAPEHRAMAEEDYFYTLPASLTGWPAVAVPLGRTPQGLPVAVQVMARPWRDDVALAAASALGVRQM